MSDMDSEDEKENSPSSSLPDKSISITDLFGSKHLNKSICKFIDAVSSHVGIRHEPTRIIKTAKAEAKAAIIRAKTDAKIKKVEWRANNRLNNLEIRRQKNIESVVIGSVPLLPEQISDEQPSEDWMYEFFNNCQDIGDKEMQTLWSKILAGELSKPGRYSMRTLNLVKTLTKVDAHLFTNVCMFVWMPPQAAYLFTQETDNYLLQHGITFGSLMHLEGIGLIIMPYGASVRTKPDRTVTCRYFDRVYKFTMPDRHGVFNIPISIQVRSLTQIGMELASISGAIPDYGYVDCLIESLKVSDITAERLE